MVKVVFMSLIQLKGLTITIIYKVIKQCIIQLKEIKTK